MARLEAEVKERRALVATLQGGELGNTDGFSQYFAAFGRHPMRGVWLTGFSVGDSGNESEDSRPRALHADLVPAYLKALNDEGGDARPPGDRAQAGRARRVGCTARRIRCVRRRSRSDSWSSISPPRCASRRLAQQARKGRQAVKEQLKRYVERVDNATLRERVLLFGAAALVLLFVANALLIQPLRDTQRRLDRVRSQQSAQTELRTVQTELQRMAHERQADPEARSRASAPPICAPRWPRSTRRIAQEQRRFTTPQRMREVLEEMLERNKRLQLVDLKTLPVTDLAATQGQSGRRVFRHGVELTRRGGYLDLYAYLRSLEELSTQLYWGKVEMSVTAYPSATLKLTVYTVSFDKAWLVV